MENEKDNPQYDKDKTDQKEPMVLLSSTNISAGKYSYILKKSEKLSAVLYKLTEFISDRDEIKWDIRELSARIVADLALESISRSHSKTNVLYNTCGALAALVSLCAVCEIAGYFSEMNYQIVRGECENLIREILGDEQDVRKEATLLKEMLEIRDYEEDPKYLKDDYIKDSIKDIGIMSDSVANVRKTIATGGNNKSLPTAFLSSRQEMIIKHIRRNGESGIKDITPHIVGCSEKTVQRDLIHLVELGVLKKNGERRWSRYSVV